MTLNVTGQADTILPLRNKFGLVRLWATLFWLTDKTGTCWCFRLVMRLVRLYPGSLIC
jgi:hypothetical protein